MDRWPQAPGNWSRFGWQAAALSIRDQTTRALAREIIGPSRFIEVYMSASLAACARRDPKGLYAKAKSGAITAFTVEMLLSIIDIRNIVSRAGAWPLQQESEAPDGIEPQHEQAASS